MLAAGACVDQVVKGGFTPLYIAAVGGCLDLVRELVRVGAHVNHADDKGETALFRAAASGHLEVARELIKAGASPTVAREDGATPLYAAACVRHHSKGAGHLELVRELIDASLGGWKAQVEANGSLVFISSAFCTAALPNEAKVAGRVRYEVTLKELPPLSVLLLQMGWATEGFAPISTETTDGTGDDIHSWGADGGRQTSWHNGPHGSYPVQWAAGDVIGVAANLDTGTVSFAKNDEQWIELFKGCDLGGKGLFPSISLGIYGACEVNVGNTPFKYPAPDETYEPAAPGVRALVRHKGDPRCFDGSF